jgi:hypothetical protein
MRARMQISLDLTQWISGPKLKVTSDTSTAYALSICKTEETEESARNLRSAHCSSLLHFPASAPLGPEVGSLNVRSRARLLPL